MLHVPAFEAFVIPIHRLSPKNQVTVPRDCRALAGLSDVTHLRGLMTSLPRRPADAAAVKPAGATGKAAKAIPDELFRFIALMTETELQRREQAILAASDLDGTRKQQLVTALNGGAARMAVDAQNRVVLPPHFVAYLKLDRDAFFNPTNTTIQLWHPADFLRWSGIDQGAVHDPDLTRFLAI